MQKPNDNNLEELVPEIAETPVDQDGLLDDLKPDEKPTIENPTEKEAILLDQIDVYLNRMFRIGELLPWKGVTFRLVGINSGIIGLKVAAFKAGRKKPVAKRGLFRGENRPKIAKRKAKSNAQK